MIETFTVVGGGSAYAPGLVQALLHSADRHELTELRLFDIDEKHLQIVANLAEKMSRAHGTPFEVTATTDKTEAVTDIDALLNSSRPGGFECRRIDETLPLEFDIPGQETVGPGGFFFALRSVPEAMDLARQVREHSPDAIWLNYTNPTNIVGQALHDRTELELLTLCDQSDADLAAVAHALDRPEAEIEFTCVGLNHATWYDAIRFDGKPLPRAAYETDPPGYYDEEHKLRFRLSQPLAKRHSGRWPNSYLPYYFRPQKFVDLARREGPRTDSIVEKIDSYYEHFAEEARSESPELEYHRGSEGFGDMAVDVLTALESEEPDELVLNVPNRGMAEEFAEDTLVEVRVGLSRVELQRRDAPRVPEGELAKLKKLEQFQRKTAEAAVDGDPADLVDALEANPLVRDRETAEGLLERAEEVYGSRIPVFG